MKQYLTAREVEDLASRGLTQIPIGDEVILTDVARDRAVALGVTFVRDFLAEPTPEPQASPPPRTLPSASSVVLQGLGPKPSGCLHDHLGPGRKGTAPAVAASGGSPLAAPAAPAPTSGSLVDRLADAVRRLRS